MSNPGGVDLNSSPYFDDYDEDKKFVRVLYRPGRAVQARELSQAQTYQQKQVERFANYFFKQGSILDGCEQTLDLNLPYVKIESTYKGSEVDVEDFNGVQFFGANTGITAFCGIVSDIEGNDPKTLFINYVSSGSVILTANSIGSVGNRIVIGGEVTFAGGNTGIVQAYTDTSVDNTYKIYVSGIKGSPPSLDVANSEVTTATVRTLDSSLIGIQISNSVDKRTSSIFENAETLITKNLFANNVLETTNQSFANTLATNATRFIENEGLATEVIYDKGSKITIGDGIIYVADHFVKNTKQTLVLDKYKNLPSYKVGFVPSKTFIDSIEDTTLVDNAQGTPNFQAPGADRLKIDTVLTKIELGVETDETDFISLLEVDNGIVKKRKFEGLEGKLEEAIAVRTFEESGNYTLSDPKVVVREHLNQNSNNGRYSAAEGGNNDLLWIDVDPFVSYVKGFRNELVIKSGVSVRKGLDTQLVEQVKTQLVLGGYIPIKEYVGAFSVNDNQIVDLYDTPQIAISNNTYSSTSLAGSKIGEARIKTIEYYSGTSGTASAIYNLYLYDVTMNSGENFADVRSIYFSDTPNTFADIVLDAFGDATLRETAFDKLIFKLPYDGIKTIRDENNNVESGFRFKKEFDNISFTASTPASIVTTDASETFVGTGTLSAAQRNDNFIVIPKTTANTTALTGTVTISASSNVVVGTSTTFTTQLNVGDVIKANNISIQIASISNNTHLVLTESHSAGATGAAYYKEFPAGKPISLSGNGQSAARIVSISSPSTVSIELNEAVNFQAIVIATMDRSNAREKKKILVANTETSINPNTHPQGLSGPYSLGYGDIYRIKEIYETEGDAFTSLTGTVTITGSNTTVEGTGTLFSVELSPGETVRIFDIDRVINTITSNTLMTLTVAHPGATANSFTLVDSLIGFDYDPDLANSATYNIVTSNYTLDNGQRDNSYRHGAIVPKLGVVPQGRLKVVFDHFTHDTTQGVGYFSIDSYPINDSTTSSTTIRTTQVPAYTSTRTGETFDLKNCLDFRPIIAANTTSNTNPTESETYQSVTGGLHIPAPTSDFDSDLQYYKGRKAKLFINFKGELGIIDGSPGYPNPSPPPGVPDALELAELELPPYPTQPANVELTLFKNKRYTMKDIGRIQERVDRLEYFTALNLLEKEARDKIIVDSEGLDRFKNGILVDSFTGHNVADVLSPDYKASIDRFEKYASAYSNNEVQISLRYNSTGSSGVTVTNGRKLMLSYTQATFAQQPYASTFVNLSQDLNFNWVGDMNVIPATDNWLNTIRDPNRENVSDSTGQSDNWKRLSDAWNTEVDPVNRHWIGINVAEKYKNLISSVSRDATITTTSTVVDRSNLEIPTSEKNTAVDRVTDSSVNHVMRSRDFIFESIGLKDNTKLYAYFDGVDVTANCTQIRLVGSTQVKDLYSMFDNDGILAANSSLYTTLSAGDLRVENNRVVGVLRVPANTFNIGQREFKLTDSSTNSDSLATTLSRKLIYSQGLSLNNTDDVLNTTPPSIVYDDAVLVETVQRNPAQTGLRRFDPVAQSFYIDENTYPQGIFLSSIDLYFKTKSSNSNIGVRVEIRKMQNGFPSRKVIGGASVRVSNSGINTSATSATATTFTFDSPVYLPSKAEYCFTVRPDGNYNDFQLWVAELGQIDITNSQVNIRIDKQPASGTLFTASNSTSWTAKINQDIKFLMRLAEFSTTSSGVALIQNRPVAANYTYNSFIPNIENLTLSRTNVNYEFRLTDSSYNVSDFKPVKNFEKVSEVLPKYVANTANETANINTTKSMTLRATLSTQNKYITPYIDLERVNVALENKSINNSVSNTLTGTVTYTNGSNVIVGSGTAFTTELNAGEYILLGEEYRQVAEITNTIYLTVRNNLTTSGSGATVTQEFEESPTGPYTSQSRYITRRVSLNDGFEASDLNVYIDVNRSAGTDIKVYYKILNENDTDNFDDKFYKQMTLDGTAIINDNQNVYAEEKYVISTTEKTGGSQILNGTVEVSDVSTNVIGTSTRFIEELRIGDTIAVGTSRIERVVSNIVNNTFLTVESVFGANASSQDAYKILADTVGYTTPDGRTYVGYKYFTVKIVFTSENTSYSPRIKNLRAIALA
jgi:hypothetical protein